MVQQSSETDSNIVALKIDKQFTLLTTLIRWVCTTIMVGFLWLIVRELAGKVTVADLSIAANFLINQNLDRLLAYLLGGGGFVYGLYQRQLRKRTIARFQGQIVALEQRIDPTRSSCNLTYDGSTRPEDE